MNLLVQRQIQNPGTSISEIQHLAGFALVLAVFAYYAMSKASQKRRPQAPTQGAPMVLKGPTGGLIGRNILYYPRLTSTMEMGKQLAREGMGEGTVIIAGEQTEGRGRLGRTWVSPPEGSISLSIILHPSMAQLPQLNMVASLATLRSITRVTGLKPLIKWPNDILINGKKVSGILIENAFEGGDLKAAIVGIGINVIFDPASFPEIALIATSLSIEACQDVSAREVMTSLLKEFDELYGDLQRTGTVYDAWLPFVETVGKWVTVRSGDSIEEGHAEAIEVDGSLILRKSDGSRLTLTAGEVSLHV